VAEKKGRIVLPVVIFLIFFAGKGEFNLPEVLEVGKFSATPIQHLLPIGWELLTFKKIKYPTTYTLVNDDKRTVVKAMSRHSSSGLIREVTINSKAYPIIHWSWKVENILQKGDLTRKSGDDYPARIYITFKYDSSRVGIVEKVKYEAIKLLYGEYPPLAAINYIWANKARLETLAPNPYTDRVQMIVTQSGSANLKKWMTEERNVYEDYKRAFGQEPPDISGVAIMTDTDNTNESAVAYFGDIVFKKKPDTLS